MAKRKLNNEEITSLPRLYNSGLSSWVIAKKFSTYHSNILYHLKKLGINRRSRSLAAKEGVKAGRIKIRKHKLPDNLKINGHIAYILGVIAGDGYIEDSSIRRTHYIGLSATDEDFVKQFRKVLYIYFKIKPTNEFRKSKHEKWKDQFATRLCSKKACEFIKQFGELKKDNWRVPKTIIDSSDSVRCSFIRGFFDSEGEIDKKIGRVGATSMNLKGLKEIQELLINLGTKSTIRERKDPRPNTSQNYVLRIHDKRSINLFYNFIGFTIQRKQNILRKFLLSKNMAKR